MVLYEGKKYYTAKELAAKINDYAKNSREPIWEKLFECWKGKFKGRAKTTGISPSTLQNKLLRAAKEKSIKHVKYEVKCSKRGAYGFTPEDLLTFLEAEGTAGRTVKKIELVEVKK